MRRPKKVPATGFIIANGENAVRVRARNVIKTFVTSANDEAAPAQSQQIASEKKPRVCGA